MQWSIRDVLVWAPKAGTQAGSSRVWIQRGVLEPHCFRVLAQCRIRQQTRSSAGLGVVVR